MARRRHETYVSGGGTVERVVPDASEDHDEIVVRTRDGRVIRISNNTRLGKMLRPLAGESVRYNGWMVDGTNVVHRLHPNPRSRGGWLEDLGPEGVEKSAASQKVLALLPRSRRRVLMPSLDAMARFLARFGGTPEKRIRAMLSDREPLVNGMRVFYA